MTRICLKDKYFSFLKIYRQAECSACALKAALDKLPGSFPIACVGANRFYVRAAEITRHAHPCAMGKHPANFIQNANKSTRSGQARRPLRPPGPEASHWSRRKPGFGKYLCVEGSLWCCRFSAFGRPWPPGGCSRQPRKLPAAYPARLRRFMMPLAKADQVPVL